MDENSVVSYISNMDINKPLIISIYVPADIDSASFINTINKIYIDKNIKIDCFLTFHFACRYIQLIGLLKDLYLFIDTLTFNLKLNNNKLKYSIIDKNDFNQLTSILELRHHLFKILKHKDQDISRFKFDTYIFTRLYQIDEKLSFMGFIYNYCLDLIHIDKTKLVVDWKTRDVEAKHRQWCIKQK